MANKIKYNLDADKNSLNIQKWSLGLRGSGMGPTSTTGFYNGLTIPPGGFVVYSDNINIRSASDDKELIFILNKLGAGVLTLTDGLKWAKNNGHLVLNDSFGNITTDGLVTYLDAKHVSSYPGGAVWYNLHGESKPLEELKVLGISHNNDPRYPLGKYFSDHSDFTLTEDLVAMDVAYVVATYDLVIADHYVWSVPSNTMSRLKEIVDLGVSCIAVGNDTRTNVFVSEYDNSKSIHNAHTIKVESDSSIGLYNKQYTNHGSADLYGGIVSLKNGAKAIYKRTDVDLITGYIYGNTQFGSALYFDQEGFNTVSNNEIFQSAFKHVTRNIGNKANFVNDPVFDNSTKSFSFDENNEFFSLSKTSTENLAGDVTLLGFCKQDSTGAPHQTLLTTALNYRNGVKLMSRYHGPASFWIGNSDGTDSYLLSSGVDITNDGLWHHLAATRNSTTGEIKIYVDGVLKNTAISFKGNLSMEGDAAVGVDYHSAGYAYYGSISSVKSYNRVLSISEIQRDYYGSSISIPSTSQPYIVLDPANIKSFHTGDAKITSLGSGADQYIIEGEGTKSPDHGGILKLNAGRIYRASPSWYGKMAISWWMKTNTAPLSRFYTESNRGPSGCARIYSDILSNGIFRFRCWDNSSSRHVDFNGSVSVDSKTNVADGKWHHVTCQWSNGSGNQPRGIYVYVNGLLEGHTECIGNDGSYAHQHLGGVSGCLGEITSTTDFGPIIQYTNYNLTGDEVYENYRAHAVRFK